MADLKDQVESFIRTEVLLPRDAAAVVGVSGGPDSVCLAHLLWRLAPAWGWRLHVAHLNHGLRGAEADEDARFVASLAAGLGLPFSGGRSDVAALAAQPGLSVEEAARLARYGFLGEVAASVGAGVVVVGHNADDQAETVLMHFLRGSGLAGLRGMLPVAPLRPKVSDSPAGNPGVVLVRPLLATPRAAIINYCAEQGLATRHDLSNDDPAFLRNRLRHELLPLLETYNPGIRQVLAHTAAVMAGDYELLASALTAAWEQVAVGVTARGGDEVYFDRGRWRGLPIAMQRATIREAISVLRHNLRNVNWKHIEGAVSLAHAGSTGQVAILPGGLALEIGYDLLRIAPAGRPWPVAAFPQVAAPLTLLPGITPLGQGWQITLRLVDPGDLPVDFGAGTDPWSAWLDADVAAAGLILRPRQAGDRFQPEGLAGHTVRLAEFMIDAKVPRAARPGWPILAGGRGILWVCGLRVDQRAAMRPTTQRVWFARFSRVGG